MELLKVSDDVYLNVDYVKGFERMPDGMTRLYVDLPETDSILSTIPIETLTMILENRTQSTQQQMLRAVETISKSHTSPVVA